MPIYAMENTHDGVVAIEHYDGENSDIPFLQAVILTRVQEITTYVDVIRFLTQEYPLELADGAITNAVLKLEKRGFLKVYREIDLGANINVDIGDFTVPTVLGSFANACLARGKSVPISEICSDLKWHGFSNKLDGVTVRLR